ncbi:MAG: hypothetical protein IPK25_09475 [Saprospiraceae bacterium]|nr:hypothetical protein [Saprospiraceae bacterium]
MPENGRNCHRWTRDNPNVGTAKTQVAKVTGCVCSGIRRQGCSATDQMESLAIQFKPPSNRSFRQHLIFCRTGCKIIMPTTNGTKFQWYRNKYYFTTRQINKDFISKWPGPMKLESRYIGLARLG